MNASTAARLALFLFASAAVACGGKTVSSDSASSSQQAQSAGAGQKGSAAPQGSSSGGAPTKASDCVDTNMGGGSSGVDGNGVASYMTSETFQCPSGEKTIECTCYAANGGPWGQGSCTCDGLTFPFDCANNGPGPAEYAKCGFPTPTPSSSGEGSTSSSSGYSSSGSSGSSGSGSSSSSSGG